MTAATADGRVLQLTRAGYGVALLLKPGLTIHLATGRPPSRRACRVAWLLGARHLAQTTLTALAPRPGVFAVGAAADALHAASMLMLAVVDRAARRTALTDAMAEAAFAAAGLATAATQLADADRPRAGFHPRGLGSRSGPANRKRYPIWKHASPRLSPSWSRPKAPSRSS